MTDFSVVAPVSNGELAPVGGLLKAQNWVHYSRLPDVMAFFLLPRFFLLILYFYSPNQATL